MIWFNDFVIAVAKLFMNRVIFSLNFSVTDSQDRGFSNLSSLVRMPISKCSEIASKLIMTSNVLY